MCPRCGESVPAASRFCPSCGASLAQGGLAAPVRKHVVVLFVDLVGSTALVERVDPEVLRRQLSAYFDAVCRAVWQAGGTVEKFIGDAVMAVFGVPATREDDAVRALHAATAIHEAVRTLSVASVDATGFELHVRIGVSAGSVYVTHQPDGQFSVTGDAVNTAARLQSVAGTDETYVGAAAAELAAGLVRLEEVAELDLRGKAVPERTWRLVNASPTSRLDADFVGRAAETADLERMLDAVLARRRGCLVTYVADAGVGKSRLWQETAASRPALRVAVAGCDSIGGEGSFGILDGILTSLFDGAPGGWSSEIPRLLGPASDGVVQRLSSALGLSDAPTAVEDVVWAVQQVMEAVATDAGLALVWEDVHAAADEQLELIEALSRAAEALPVISVCLTRPQLFERRPSWGGGRWARVDELPGLPPEDLGAMAAQLAPQLTDGVEDLVERCDGNPQVLQLMLQCAQVGDDVPVTVRTLFEAALDRMSTEDRRVCEAASVYGRQFSVDGVRAILDAHHDADHPAADVVAHGVYTVEPTKGDFAADAVDQTVRRLKLGRVVEEVPGTDRFQFCQALLADTVYATMPKAMRIRRHSAAADWLAGPAGGVGRSAATIAVHRDRAWMLSAELDGATVETGRLRESAVAAHLHAMRTLIVRGDPGAHQTADRLQELLPVGDERHFEVAFTRLLFVDRSSGAATIRSLVERTDLSLASHPAWQVVRRTPLDLLDLAAGTVDVETLYVQVAALLDGVKAILPVPFHAKAFAYLFGCQVTANFGRIDESLDLCRRAVREAVAAGDLAVERVFQSFELHAGLLGQLPLSRTVALGELMRDDSSGSRQSSAGVNAVLAAAYGLAGQSDLAAERWASAADGPGERLLGGRLLEIMQYRGQILVASGDLVAAASFHAELADEATSMPLLRADFLIEAARLRVLAGDAQRAAQTLAEIPNLDIALSPFLADTLSLVRAAAGLVTAAPSLSDLEVERLESEASTLGPLRRGQRHWDLGALYRARGDLAGASRHVELAVDAFQQKGAAALVAGVRNWHTNRTGATA